MQIASNGDNLNEMSSCFVQTLIVLGFNDTSTLVGFPEKGRKKIEEIVEDMNERDREERGTGMKVKKQKK